jgi:ABC-2 type transport system permease protein
MIGLFSQITGLWARKWDYLESVQTFIFMPFVFLSGVFFSIDELSATAQPFARANPVFYIVDGIRFAITGRADANPWIGAGVIIAVIVVLWIIGYRLFVAGYRMKS